MKKLRSVLSLFLLSLVGLMNVNAQSYHADMDNVLQDESIEAIVGQPVMLRAAFAETDGYLTGAKRTSGASDDAVYTFVASGNTIDVDGVQEPTYYLKQLTTGKYLKDQPTLGRGEDSSDYPDETGACVSYTDNQAEAFEFTALVHDASQPTGRRAANDGWSAISRKEGAGYVFCRVKDFGYTTDEAESDRYLYLGCMNPWAFLSPYQDTNLWDIYPAIENSGYEYLENGMRALLGDNMSYDEYQAGVDPGYYGVAELEAAQAALIACNDVIDSGECTVDEAKQLIATLTAADEALKASMQPIHEGYFFLHDNNSKGSVGADDWMYVEGHNMKMTKGYTLPDEITTAEAPYIWKLIKAEGENMWFFQNYSTGEIASFEKNGNAIVTNATGNAYMVTPATAAKASFNIYKADNASFCWNAYHNNGQVIGTWGDKNDLGNCWSFVSVSNETIAALEAEVAQNRLNTNLASVYNKAFSTYASARSYTSDATADQNFDDPGLVQTAAALSTNAPSAAEEANGNGFLAGLLDGDFTTFFHSDWKGTSGAEGAHFVQADLGKAVQALQIKYAKRTGGNYLGNPDIIEVQVTNDTLADWQSLGTVNLTYDIPLVKANAETGENDTTKNVIGMAAFDLGGAYRYVRIVNNHTPANSKYFYFSELHFYEAAYDAANSQLNVVSAATISAFEAQLANAQAKLAAGNATQADIDALQAAYDALVNELPVPARLTDAIAAAKALKNGAIEGTEVGTYSADAIAALAAAIEKAEAAVKPVMTNDEINAGLAPLEASVAAFKTAINLPEVGQYYVLRSKGTAAPDAMVYANGTKVADGLKFKAQVLNDPEDTESGKTDAVDYSKCPNYIWVVDQAAAGKIVVRNLGTGMIIGKAEEKNNAQVALSTTAVENEIVSGSAAGQFCFKISDAMYMHTQGGTGNLVAWNSNGGNAEFVLEPIAKEAMDAEGIMTLPVTAGNYQIMTLPVEIQDYVGSMSGKLYTLVGQNEEHMLVLAEVSGNIEAGTPFIYLGAPADELLNNEEVFYLATPLTEAEPTYCFEGKEANGLQGVIAQSVTLTAGNGVLYGGQVNVIGETTPDYISTVGAGSGYFNGKHALDVTEAGDAQIAIPNGKEITAIKNVVVLPATVNVYTTAGVLVRKNVKSADAVKNLPAGAYIVGGQKVLVK